MPDDMDAQIRAELSYGDNRSEWIREAVRMRLDREQEPESHEREKDDTDDERDDIAAALTGWSHGRNNEERQASQQVARAALAWLRDRDAAASRSDVPLQSFDDPLDRTDDTLWTEVVRDAWTHAVEKGYLTKPHSRAYEWDNGDGV